MKPMNVHQIDFGSQTLKLSAKTESQIHLSNIYFDPIKGEKNFLSHWDKLLVSYYLQNQDHHVHEGRDEMSSWSTEYKSL